MKIDVDLWPQIREHRWKWADIRIDYRGILWHATRSGIYYGEPKAPFGFPWSVGWEFTSTVNWFLSPNNGKRGTEIAGMANYIVGDGKIALCVPEELVPRYSAGVHDRRGISIEVCQPTNDTAYAPGDILLARELRADIMARHPEMAPGRVAWVGASNAPWFPSEVGHEDTAQGKGQGKSDPGAMFWSAYLEDEMSIEAEQLLLRVCDVVGGHPNGVNYQSVSEALPYFNAFSANDIILSLGLGNTQGDVAALQQALAKHLNDHPGGGPSGIPEHEHGGVKRE